MAEKKKTAKKKNPRFGGKRDLKDMDKSGGISFGDTFLGDLLGFDKDGMGLQGRAGLLKSLKGARRKKPGQGAPKRPATKKKKVPKADPGRQTNPIPINKKPKRNEPGRNTNPIPVKPKAPTAAERKASHRRMMKRVTLQAWKDMSPSERTAAGLPKNNQEVFKATGALTLGAGKFTGAFKANRGGLAKKKPVAKMNKGGMAKKSGYMYGGSVTKKKPMNKGGMAKKK